MVYSNEVFDLDYALIIVMCFRFDFNDEFWPIVSNLLVKSSEYLYAFVLVHLLMNVTEVKLIDSWLEALRMVASVYFVLKCYVLSKVKTLRREHVCSNGHLKVLVRD
jgi:hypothetical protein